MKTNAHKQSAPHTYPNRPLRDPGESFVAVYIDDSVDPALVRQAVAELPTPFGVEKIVVDSSSITGTLGCRIAVDLTGSFDERREGFMIARGYALRVSEYIGAPAFALRDLILAGSANFNHR